MFCERDHWNNNCDKYPTVERWINFLKKEKGCFNCLRKGHNSKVCKRPKKKCFHCRADHHSALCKEFVRKQSSSEQCNQATVVSATEGIKKDRSNERQDTTTTTTSAYVRQVTNGPERKDQIDRQVLLLCRTVIITNPQDFTKKASATAFFGPGSKVSFISKHLANKIELHSGSKHICWHLPAATSQQASV